MEPLFLNFLRDTLGIKGIKRVSMHEPLTNIRKVIALDLRARHADDRRSGARFTARRCCIAPPANTSSRSTTISTRKTPTRSCGRCPTAPIPTLDFHILPHRDQGHGPRSKRNGGQDASVLIDATLKEDFPPISLPKREYMERAKVIWEELGLPKLKPESPWFGYSLGEWSPELDEAAERATRGDYFETGKELWKNAGARTCA